MHAPLAVGITALIAFSSGLALWSDQDPGAPHDTARVARATSAFLASLSPALRQQACRPLTDEERTKWHFVPGRYAGVELGALDDEQRELAHGVLQSFLSAAGHAKTKAVMDLENVLHELESRGGRDASHRSVDRYALLVFGEPSDDGTYAVRLQGHHVSLQFVVHDGHVAGQTPQFLGSNPHEVRSGEQRGLRVLGAEEDLARALMLLLDERQLQQAVISETAPRDVMLGPGKPPSALGPRRGLPWQQLSEVQRGVLWRLIEEYATLWHGDFAAAELARIQNGGLDELCFAWAGGRERGEGHYYRIHGNDFAIEYDNTQNDANHVHTVWRDFERDHGGDLLLRHLQEHHGGR